jgi:hypothetical protein
VQGNKELNKKKGGPERSVGRVSRQASGESNQTRTPGRQQTLFILSPEKENEGGGGAECGSVGYPHSRRLLLLLLLRAYSGNWRIRWTGDARLRMGGDE